MCQRQPSRLSSPPDHCSSRAASVATRGNCPSVVASLSRHESLSMRVPFSLTPLLRTRTDSVDCRSTALPGRQSTSENWRAAEHRHLDCACWQTPGGAGRDVGAGREVSGLRVVAGGARGGGEWTEWYETQATHSDRCSAHTWGSGVLSGPEDGVLNSPEARNQSRR